jgi:hypothetical protein
MLNWIFLIVLLIVAILAILFNLHARKSKNSPTVKNSPRLNQSTSNHTLSHGSRSMLNHQFQNLHQI